MARRLRRNLEVEVLVGGVRLGPPNVVVDAGAADEGPGHADLLRHLAGDRPDALRPRQEEGVALQHVLVLVEALLDETDSVAHLLVPPRGGVVARAPDLMEAVEQPRAGHRLEEVEHPFALTDAVEEDRGAASESAAHVEAPR